MLRRARPRAELPAETWRRAGNEDTDASPVVGGLTFTAERAAAFLGLAGELSVLETPFTEPLSAATDLADRVSLALGQVGSLRDGAGLYLLILALLPDGTSVADLAKTTDANEW